MKEVDGPPAELREGDEWVVETRAMGSKWDSRARAQEIDRSRLRFAYRSQTDDGNPSFGLWTWSVIPEVRTSVRAAANAVSNNGVKA